MASHVMSEDVEEFLNINEVLDEWKSLFRENPRLNQFIHDIVGQVKSGRTEPVPERHNILRAFSYRPPRKVKVVIVGYKPIGDSCLATGLSFSYPRFVHVDDDVGNRNRPKIHGKGQSVPIVHDALCAAGILEHSGTYDCCHEEWAQRGVLLLNASLIYDYYWLTSKTQDFIAEIMFEVALLRHRKYVFYLCWGTDSEAIGNSLHEKLLAHKFIVKKITYEKNKDIISVAQDAKCVIYIGDHPTYPRDEVDVKVNFYLEQASKQFRKINEVCPGIFDLMNLKVKDEHIKSGEDGGKKRRHEDTPQRN